MVVELPQNWGGEPCYWLMSPATLLFWGVRQFDYLNAYYTDIANFSFFPPLL